jgi:hypothetical protein
MIMSFTKEFEFERWLDLGKLVLMAVTKELDEQAQANCNVRSDYAAHVEFSPTEYEIACEFLDLSSKEPFTCDDMGRKVREFRILYHPDVKGETERNRLTKLSQRVAWSEQVINKHRDW